MAKIKLQLSYEYYLGIIPKLVEVEPTAEAIETAVRKGLGNRTTAVMISSIYFEVKGELHDLDDIDENDLPKYNNGQVSVRTI